MDAVVITTYNRWVYFHQRVDWETRLGDSFETDRWSKKRATEGEDAAGEDHGLQSASAAKGNTLQEQAILEKGASDFAIYSAIHLMTVMILVPAVHGMPEA